MKSNSTLTQNQAMKKHFDLLLHLNATREKLMMVDPQSLDLDHHIQWNEQLYQVGLAISAAQKAILTSLSDSYVSKLPKIEKAMDKLTDELYKLKAATDVINAVDSVLATISSIVGLIG